MRQLISETINSKLDEIVTKCFEGNRIADRGMSILSIKFAMVKTVKILHPKLAHLFPVLADDVSDYQGSRNNLTVYGVTPLDNTNYNTPLEFFERILDHTINLEGSISEAIIMCDDEDYSTKSFLYNFMRSVVKVTEQCLLLVDKAEQYNDDWKLFDENIDSFVIL